MRLRYAAAVGVAAAVLAAGTTAAYAGNGPFVGPFTKTSTVASTVPANGDINPYGIALVPRAVGKLRRGNVLISNFNAASNLQGTGTTIVQVSPSGTTRLFAQIDGAHLPGACPGGVGLTTALTVLSSGWVIVGSLPTLDGTAATSGAGCLLVLDSGGVVRETFSGHGINGPWDMTAADNGDSATLLVTNVLNGTVAAAGAVSRHGTVLRLDLAISGYQLPHLRSVTTIGSGFAERTDPAAMVVGPTGLALAFDGTVYVADSASNRITAIANALTRDHSAGTGRVVTTGGHLNTPLGLAIAPGGDLLSVNGGDGLLVETTPAGVQVATRVLDTTAAPPAPAGAGALFGLVPAPDGHGVYYVDDAANTLNLLH
jgi:hypothetical protein